MGRWMAFVCTEDLPHTSCFPPVMLWFSKQRCGVSGLCVLPLPPESRASLQPGRVTRLEFQSGAMASSTSATPEHPCPKFQDFGGVKVQGIV